MAKKTTSASDGIAHLLLFSRSLSSFSTILVICLSDDEPDDDIMDIRIDTPVVSPAKQPDSPIVINNNDDDNNTSNSNKKRNDNNNNIDDKSAWILTEKDIIHPSPLPSKYSDLYKKAFEIRCSAIRFGITEFNVDTEVVLMHPKEFEMKITGQSEMFSRQTVLLFDFNHVQVDFSRVSMSNLRIQMLLHFIFLSNLKLQWH